MNNLHIRQVAENIKRHFKPQKIILFGSQAYGEPIASSDLDIFVIMETALKFYKQAAAIRLMLDRTMGVHYPMDIIVRTPEFINKRVQEGDFFIKAIMEKGIVL